MSSNLRDIFFFDSLDIGTLKQQHREKKPALNVILIFHKLGQE